MYNESNRNWTILIILVLAIMLMIGLIVNQEIKINAYEKVFDYIEAEIKEKEILSIDEPEDILIEFTTEGEFAKEFHPQLFLKVTGTDLSRCLIDDRLRIDLNGEIYWIRLEK